jgi:hypothetical protein
MGTRDLLSDFDDAGITLYMDGGTLKAKPASKLHDVVKQVIRDNKPALIAALTLKSDYWLIDGAILVTYSPPASYETVRADYPSRLVAPLTDDQWRAFEVLE